MRFGIPPRVLCSYDIGRVQQVTRIASGLIHQTYKIKASKGIFILQRLHPMLATKAIAEDFRAVTSHLESRGFSAPTCVLTKRGEVLSSDGRRRWRMQTCLPGRTYHTIKNTVMAREAGRMYAKLHRTLGGIPHTFRSASALHDTKKIYDVFLKTVRRYRSSLLMQKVKNEMALVRRELPKLFLPRSLPRRVIHGDPKISNILFSGTRATAIVDLDTCNRHTVLVDLGDAFRSWCGKAEDDPHNHFRVDMFRAAWRGYKKEAEGFLTNTERCLVPKAIALITLELAARFLTDYFNNTYFGWDRKRYASRRAHNLARAKGQIALYQSLTSQQAAIRQILINPGG